MTWNWGQTPGKRGRKHVADLRTGVDAMLYILSFSGKTRFCMRASKITDKEGYVP